VPAWAGLAAAAAVLFALGLASYAYFAATLPGGTSLAHHGRNSEGQGTDQGTGLPQDHKILSDKGQGVAAKRDTPSSPLPVDPLPHPPEKGPVVEGPRIPPPALDPEPDLGSPKDNAGPVLTDRGMEIFDIKTVELAPPLILSLRDLDQDAVRQKLQIELGKNDGFRLELPVADATRSMDRLQSVCKSAGVNLIVDQVAQGRVKTPQWKTNYVVYAETMTPADLVRLLQALAVADKNAAAKKPADVLLDRMVLFRMNRGDRRELGDLLNIDPAQLSRGTGPLGTDLKRPLADQTGDQLAQLLKGQGGQSAGKGPEHAALAVSTYPVRPHRNSAEIKRFLEGRKPLGPGTIQLMLVLRNVG